MKMIKYGKITIKIKDEIIYEIDILTKNNIPKKEVMDYIKEIGQNFFRNNLQIWLEG